jgi:ABC-2 type transport system permease protein
MKSLLRALLRAMMRTVAMAAKEAAHIRRDPQTLIMAFAMPVGLLLLFGYGVTFDLERLPVVTIDYDHTAASRSIVSGFGASRDLVVSAELGSVAQGEAWMRAGKAVAVVVIPDGFSRKLARGESADLQLVVDGADATTAMQTINKADAVASNAIAVSPTMPAVGVARLIADTWTLYNPGGRSALLLVPGLMA